jgi:imidazolonepropionase-like amidohydrolase
VCAVRRLVIADIDWLITIDAGRRIIRDAGVAVDKGKIVAIDKSVEIEAFRRTRVDRRRRTVATPGFIDPICISPSHARPADRPTRSRSVRPMYP